MRQGRDYAIAARKGELARTHAPRRDRHDRATRIKRARNQPRARTRVDHVGARPQHHNVFAAGVDRSPTRGLVTTDRTARNYRHSRLNRHLRRKLCHGKTIRRGLARADDGERGRRKHLGVAAHIKRLGYIRKLQNGLGIQRIAWMQLEGSLGYHWSLLPWYIAASST